ncbi:MAG: hypothetical protein ONB46_07830 [candidate division KSB1 bacterium]|nr:hypothetical protein [candidate division KSB1 bacterium]
MEKFLNKHQDTINGTLSTFDRLIFKGHLTAFFPKGAFGRFLSTQGVLLKSNLHQRMRMAGRTTGATPHSVSTL